MGLYAEFSPSDFGFPQDLSASTEEGEVYVEVDYSEALEDAINTFINTATSLVPVDTGYLRSTIDAYSDGEGAYFSADAEYAQYPEFGTWNQSAQPYFVPALQDAIDVFVEDAMDALSEAQDEYDTEMAALMEDYSGSGGGFGASSEGDSLLDFAAGIGAALIIGFLLIPLLVAGMEISSTMTGKEGSMFDFAGISAESLVEIY